MFLFSQVVICLSFLNCLSTTLSLQYMFFFSILCYVIVVFLQFNFCDRKYGKRGGIDRSMIATVTV